MAEERTGLSAELEELYSVTLPDRLREFFDSGEYEKYDGKNVTDLEHFSSDVKMAAGFAHEALPMVYEYAADIFGCTPAELFPLAALNDCEDGTFFMAVDLTKPELPVQFFDYEEGFHDHSKSFDEFLAGLLDEGALTPAEELAAAYDKANALREEKKYQEAIDLILPVLQAYPEEKRKTLDHFGQYLPNAYNILAICYEKLEKIDEAVKYYEYALGLRSYHAGLNILDLYLYHFKDYEKLIAFGERLKEEIWKMLDEYCWFHVRKYLGYGYILTGRENDAVMMYHLIRTHFADENPEWIAKTQEDLEEIVKEDKPHKELAEKVMRWFVPQPREVSEEAAQRNRAWWATVPEKAQAHLRDEANIEAEEPSDQDLARLLDSETVDIDNCGVKDLSWVTAFTRAKRLEAEKNEITDLSPIAKMTTLERLDVGGNKVQSLEPIAALTRLTYLDCAENGLTSLAGVENLHELENIRANANQITDLTPVAGLASLEEITVYNNQVSDLSPLGSCPRLKEISSFGNPITTGLEALKDLYWLEEVDPGDTPEEQVQAFARACPHVRVGWHDVEKPAPTDEEAAAYRAWWESLDDVWRPIFAKDIDDDDDEDNEGEGPSIKAIGVFLNEEDHLRAEKKDITDLTPLTPMKRVDWMNLSKNDFTDLTPIGAFERVKVLLCRKTKVNSLKPLAGWKHIEHFDAESSALSSLEGIEGWDRLRKLSVENNQITDLAPLAGKKELRRLYVENNRIESLEPLRGLPRLHTIWLFNNRVRDLSPLAECPELETIVCFANEGLTGLMALKDLPHLRHVQTYCAVSDEEIEAFRKARPDVDVS